MPHLESIDELRITAQQVTAAAGVNFVRGVVTDCRSIFIPTPQEVDLGLDGSVEFADDGVPSGHVVAVQIKAGSSYRSAGGYR
jgi:hypothetical protein